MISFNGDLTHMGVVTPEGKILSINISRKNMIDYLKVNHMIDKDVNFGELLTNGWIFFEALEQEIKIAYKSCYDTNKTINKVFERMKCERLYFNDPYRGIYFAMDYDRFTKNGI
jgi:hypothetical protein